MEVFERLLARQMAAEAAIAALISSHPDPDLFRERLRAAAVSLSATAMTGSQPSGMQTAFDEKIAAFLRIAGELPG
ncbi:hypothetical protein L2Y94_05595 [Luteibacter aegosomatis]|uniref:hypothetical protein n=1 Tax=Luteibacter aegosomatis TaxID=2911537 RepID=UPI001FF74BB9|nr:hypothetical protein [Luteibacter aegosomatis]UPG86828.1 hypothetical protein L2Y94_05595 [Luteibacter aegosomatis]